MFKKGGRWATAPLQPPAHPTAYGDFCDDLPTFCDSFMLNLSQIF
jgi:hypothetical protein